MLADSTIFSNIAVKDIAAGKKFYGETLGLKQTDENMAGAAYASGTGKVFVYQSPTAGSGQATCATWEVADIEAVVADLKGKGVNFEHYDLPGGSWQGDVAVMGPMKAAWFKDPDGNVLGLGSAGK